MHTGLKKCALLTLVESDDTGGRQANLSAARAWPLDLAYPRLLA